MSYDPKYRKWVEKLTNKYQAASLSESNKLIEVYRGIPVFREKIKDNPPEHRFRSPRVRSRKIDRHHEKIDKQLDTTSSARIDKRDSETSYRQKYENSQLELQDMKKREASMLSKLEEIQGKVDELNAAQLRLKEEADDLRSELKASKALISDLNKK
jgi:chromosome segregation ATPase